MFCASLAWCAKLLGFFIILKQTHPKIQALFALGVFVWLILANHASIWRPNSKTKLKNQT
ncbi:hypothetical protein B0181_07040 [Moraxella caviae]|uniref:Uncharacterized protein n=1 Tax=Moraxella caviae TaxID=34060 RepID=A0A1T0A199_9GAMM|nr:hypothetical protein B0181_07040 [Moraxella caviae]